MTAICRDRQRTISPNTSHGRSHANAVSTDVDRLLGPKSLDQLKSLEKQIESKLQSNEPIDIEYWEQLLRSIAVYKAKAELDHTYKSIIQGRMANLRLEQKDEAEVAKHKLSLVLGDSDGFELSVSNVGPLSRPQIAYSRLLDPEPHLKLSSDDKTFEVMQETEFVDRIVRKSTA